MRDYNGDYTKLDCVHVLDLNLPRISLQKFLLVCVKQKKINENKKRKKQTAENGKEDEDLAQNTDVKKANKRSLADC